MQVVQDYEVTATTIEQLVKEIKCQQADVINVSFCPPPDLQAAGSLNGYVFDPYGPAFVQVER